MQESFGSEVVLFSESISDSPQTSLAAFLVDLLVILQIVENHYSRPYCLSRKVYLIILEVGVTHTHANENEEQFVGKLFRNDTIYNKTAKH